jgi:hypothetical protein
MENYISKIWDDLNSQKDPDKILEIAFDGSYELSQEFNDYHNAAELLIGAWKIVEKIGEEENLKPIFLEKIYALKNFEELMNQRFFRLWFDEFKKTITKSKDKEGNVKGINEKQKINTVPEKLYKVWVYRFFTSWPNDKISEMVIEIPNIVSLNDIIIVTCLDPQQLYGIFKVSEILKKLGKRNEVKLLQKLIFSNPVTIKELSKYSKIKEYIDRTRGFEMYTFEEDLTSAGILNEFIDILIEKNNEQAEEIKSILPFPPEPIETRIESVAGSNIPDVATENDSIGFDVYVEAIGNYLTHEDTKGPIALSIEGEWGSGKSSFMLQLSKWLKENKKNKTVWFNAWRHDKEESLWAAFALNFVDEMSKNMKGFWAKQFAKIRLMLLRYDWRNGWFDLARTVVTMIIWIIVAISIWVIGKDTIVFEDKKLEITETLWIILGFGSSLAALKGILKTIRDTSEIVGNPLRFNLKKHIQDLNYAERIGFIEQFHSDFRKIIDVYAKEEKVVVFIDDLDRCEVPKAADMMQALNLMIGEDERLFFIMGMDRQKVAAGLAVKFEKLLPYINYQDNISFEQAKFRIGTRFGYDYIEKFIQLPFRVPAPSSDNIEIFLNSLKNEEKKEISTNLIPSDQREVNVVTVDDDETKTYQGKDIDWDKFSLEIEDDSENIHNLVVLVAKVLKYNPRRIKQFINLFRLKAYISYNIGNFNLTSSIEEINSITFEQLAKFTIIELRWPLLLADLENDYGLLKRLSKYAEILTFSPDDIEKADEPKTPIEERWRNNREFVEFIALNSDPTNIDIYENFSFTDIDLSKLLQVSAKVIPPQLQNIDESKK